MKNTEKKSLNQEIDKQVEALAASYPGEDVELKIIARLTKKRREEIRRSEVESFKQYAISTLGTEHEIAFNDAERGFLQASLADGRSGFKEFIESIPVDAPTCEDGTKMTNEGIKKKTS